ncbi:MAG: 2-C-methyl-D-erythritol 4-phosphate cytidylyltransferase [Deltaproteobacteria bacterium]|nr:MAG: 2-C-methyl-D-erythritol 4-phosphate cytidylyltransferase [Deltaproteobacteria bacterium]
MNPFRHIAIIVAGGKGRRMQSRQKKQYLELEKIPVLTRTITVFDAHEKVCDIILVIPGEDRKFCREFILEPFCFTTPIHLVNGGIRRQESVFNGLKKACKLSPFFDKTLVLIHDGVRPFIGKTVLDDCIAKAIINGACIPAVKITDTVKKVLDGQKITVTLDRDFLYKAQTPQVFRLDLVLKAYAHAKATLFEGTDDASLMEHAGLPVFVTNGSLSNIKLTTPEDLSLSRYLLKTL